jgi:septal ring factor EnvC (AmiA/AmiB activator)
MLGDVLSLVNIQKRSKQATAFTLIGATIVLASLCLSAFKLNSLHKETVLAQQQLVGTERKLDEKKTELQGIQLQLDQMNTQLKFRQQVYSQLVERKVIPPAEISVAAEKALKDDPKLAEITPVVNIHISKPEQRKKAQEVEAKLEAIGYKVPEIEFVGRKAPNSSQVRYFFRSDVGTELRKIVELMEQSGVSVKEQFIGLEQNPPSLRPKEFEIWFGLDYPPTS